jgi:c-di-GMP-binding flagellar brake protein YcgR
MDTEFFVSKSHRYSQARRFSRVPTDFVVHVQSDELRVNERANDISEAGIGVVTPRPLAPMSLVSLKLELPHGVEAIEMLGRVMWATEHKMGIRFEQTDPRVTDLVSRIRQDSERI